MAKEEEIIKYIPSEIKKQVEEEMQKDLQEIRMRVGRPIILIENEQMKILEHISTKEEIESTIEKICENSIYAYNKEICDGYITIKGGHRVGIVGSCVIENEKIINIKHISSINIRIAREKKGCSNEALKYIIDYENNNIYNTLIVSPPGCGKTTLLRDIVRQISNGIPEINFKGITVGVVDERGEIAAINRGIPQNDIGMCTDVIENISKARGMKMLIRSMAPKVIVCDEIGNKEDSEAIEYATCSGVKGIFTAHGENLEMLKENKEIKEIIKKNIIQKILFLDSEKIGQIKEVVNL